jgi:hypothetical protein
MTERRHVAYPTGRATPTSIALDDYSRSAPCIENVGRSLYARLHRGGDAAHGFGAPMLAELINAGQPYAGTGASRRALS